MSQKYSPNRNTVMMTTVVVALHFFADGRGDLPHFGADVVVESSWRAAATASMPPALVLTRSIAADFAI